MCQDYFVCCISNGKDDDAFILMRITKQSQGEEELSLGLYPQDFRPDLSQLHHSLG